MDGVFMKKWIIRVACCLCVSLLLLVGNVAGDKERLREELIRLHVVANSDSPEDQALKLEVRDAVTEILHDAMADITDPEQARRYLQDNLPKIEAIANQVLQASGCDDMAVATLAREAFDTRYYDTFTLPAGVYEALRITIGEGRGHNWWCVVFPSLCVPATSQGFEDVAAGAGFPDSLTAALEGEEGYEIRFYLLDVWGRLENIWFEGGI